VNFEITETISFFSSVNLTLYEADT
jgi:hypothetical protein